MQLKVYQQQDLDRLDSWLAALKEVRLKNKKGFRDKVRKNKIHFHFETDEQLNYAIGKYLEVWVPDKEGSLQYEAQAVKHGLFEPVYKRDFNNLEEDFALYLEKSDALH